MSKHLIWRIPWFLLVLFTTGMLFACGTETETQTAGAPASNEWEQSHTDSSVPTVGISQIDILLPQADGTVVYEDNGVSLDASNTNMGYVMVCAKEQDSRLKLRIALGETTYTYDLLGGTDYAAFPLQQGDGEYSISVLKNAYDDMYEPIFEQTIQVTVDDAFSPFLMPNQFVDYTQESDAVRQSFALTAEQDGNMAKADILYRFVADTIEYDYDKAAAVEADEITSYLPDVDETLAEGRGICFDYSALLATMLRVQGIPAQLVIGRVEPEGVLHAWNLVYVDGSWTLMDATFDGIEHTEEDYTAQRVY